MEIERQKITFEQMKDIIEEDLACLLDRRKKEPYVFPERTAAICECTRTLIVLDEKIRNGG